MTNVYYCYSKRLFYFIKSFGINYISSGINCNTNTHYYVFNKSERLDKVIELYNKVKHLI